MPIPRFRDADGDYDIYLVCTKCAWAICKDRVTMNWTHCRKCGGRLETKRTDYPRNQYQPREFGRER